MFSRTRGYIPHLEIDRSTYFVTFRLADSIAAERITQWKQDLALKIATEKDPQRVDELKRFHHRRIEEYTDRGYGCCYLRNPSVAATTMNILKENDGKRYSLQAWTIMPNHVHVLFTSLGMTGLAPILKAWKGASAFYANRILSRTGTFWEREYFDRCIRSEKHFDYCVRYILNNPVKANICQDIWDWPWTGCSEAVLERSGLKK